MERGRVLVATRDIAAGETILVEPPVLVYEVGNTRDFFPWVRAASPPRGFVPVVPFCSKSSPNSVETPSASTTLLDFLLERFCFSGDIREEDGDVDEEGRALERLESVLKLNGVLVVIVCRLILLSCLRMSLSPSPLGVIHVAMFETT